MLNSHVILLHGEGNLMRYPLKCGALLLVLACLSNLGPAQAATSKAQAVLAAAKRATGGSAWDTPQGCYEEGTHGDGAISYRTRFSLRHYGMRVDSDRGGKTRSMGFDGKAQWQGMGAGPAMVRTDAGSIGEAILTNYLSINGFFFPDRFPAKITYVRLAREGTKTFDVIELTPTGSRTLEIWFDARTHLISRVLDSHAPTPVRVEASDYRQSEGLTVAYKLETFGPDGALLDRGVVTSFRCGAIDDSVFAPPK